MSDADVAAMVVANVNITEPPEVVADATGYVAQKLGTVAVAQKGAMILSILQEFSALASDPVYGSYATAFNAQIAAAVAYAQIDGTVDVPLDQPESMEGKVFNLTATEAAGAAVMRLTGDQDVRIDFTNPANQITGLDLDGDGTIEFDGAERSITGKAADFDIVDAYSRNPFDHTDTVNNFLGDIFYDGRSFAGDGVRTNGNIFLGGLGVDTAFGGVGNDFLAGGGVAQGRAGVDTLSGGRNADFFFAEFAAIDATDGSSLAIDGGNTADDISAGNGQSAQDNDWLLIEASDDDEPVQIWLNDDNVGPAEPDGNGDNKGLVLSRAGKMMVIDDIENVDASGNLYGFLDDMKTKIGERAADLRDTGDGNASGSNYGYGASAQLNIVGSNAGNIIIGGYDNDFIDGGAGNDLLMGGNLNHLKDPNLAGILNDGRDELIGGGGEDNIVFETDGGIYEGGATTNVDDDPVVDTLWLTANSYGTKDVASVIDGGVMRIDLGVGKEGGLDNFAGYGGADMNAATGNYTSDQSIYKTGYARAQVQDFESVIATGLGGIDYLAAGANKPELDFAKQQNFRGIDSALDLRGTNGANTLYAAGRDDKIEGRGGNDLLSGGEGVDDFVFNLNLGGDGLDVIWRQSDQNNDNLWDVDAAGKGNGALARIGVANQAGLMGPDFGEGSSSTTGPSKLNVDFTASDLAAPNKFLTAFAVKIGNVTFAVTDPADLAALEAATDASEVADVVDAVFSAIDPNVKVTASGDVLTITDTTPTGGRNISDNLDESGAPVDEGLRISGAVLNPGETFTNPVVQFFAAGSEVFEDRLVFAAYDNRADGELIDDDAVFGGDSLGANAYAQDLVVGFNVDGSTIVAENQQFLVSLTNLAVQDAVTVTVNGVKFSLTVGKNVDNTLIAGETTEAFAARLATYINDYLDNDTAAGKVTATFNALTASTNDGGFVLRQQAYTDGEESVFMKVSVDAKDNSSNGEPATGKVTNQSASDITLYQYDGRNGGLTAENVIFVGDAGVGPDGRVHGEMNRSVLATALNAGGTLDGMDAIVVNVTADDNITGAVAAEGIGGVAIKFNEVENPTTGQVTNYAIHGDDQLFGGNGADKINGGTGDDRIYGSKAKDQLDGGKDLYYVDGLIRVLNGYEANQVDSEPSVLEIRKLADRDGDGTIDVTGQRSSDFVDTLIYQQSDFGAVGAGGAKFTIGLDLSTDQKTGGSGHVITDGATANTALFVNMEHIRTVSGNGTLAGQGDDTLDLTRSYVINTTPATWVETASPILAVGAYYDLTKGGNAGQVWLDRDNTAAGGAWPDRYESFVTIVDGVENVNTGNGNDLLVIDQTESGKNNSFNAGGNGPVSNAAGAAIGDDRIVYQNNAVALTPAQLGTLTLTIGLGTDKATGVDTLDMTAGMLGVDTPRDTLTGVEVINTSAIAISAAEDDVLNVAGMTAGAIVNFTNNTVHNGAATAANLQATVTAMSEYETVIGSAAGDTVIVSDGMANAREDFTDVTPTEKILFESFLNYDVLDEVISPALDTDTELDRMTIPDLRAANLPAATAAIPNVLNTAQFTFDLGAGTDRVDYTAEAGDIAVVVKSGAPSTNVLVDHNGNDSYADDNDRIDVLKGVEQIVASNGESILDFTDFGQAVNIDFQYGLANSVVLGEGAVVENTVRIANASGDTITGLTSFVERYVLPITTPATAGLTATWDRIEGSDFAEKVSYDGSENLTGQFGVDHRFSNDALNLRGGDNEVSYFRLETSIWANVNVAEWDGTVASGRIATNVQFLDGTGNNLATDLLSPNQHNISSYTSDNGIAEGNLKLEATQDKEDTVTFTSSSTKVYILGTSPGVLNVEIGGLDTMVLTGFEFLSDAPTNDVYKFENLITGIELFDHSADDHDTIQVGNLAATAPFNGGVIPVPGVNYTISLAALNTTVFPGFDFDVLDASTVTRANLHLIGTTATGLDAGTTDEVIVGDLSLIDDITGFESLVLTPASAAAASIITLDLDAGEVIKGATSFDFTGNILSAGGTVLEGTYNSGTSPAVASDLTLVLVDDAKAGGKLYGGNGADMVSGAGGDDTLAGGAGNDTLNAGIATEIHTFSLVGNLDLAANLVLDYMDAGTAFSTFTEGVDFAAGSNADVVGAAIAARLDGDLAQTNLLFDADPASNIADVSYEGGKLIFRFASGYDVATTVVINVDAPDVGNPTFLSAAAVVDGGTGGDNSFRGGAGTDIVNGGAGSDEAIVVGSVSAAEATAYAITFATQAALDAVFANAASAGLVSRAELTKAHTSTDVGGTATVKEMVDGGAGVDTLHIFGTANMTNTTVSNVEVTAVHSKVTFTAAQLDEMLFLELDAGSEIVVPSLADLNKVSAIRIDAGSVKVTVGTTTATYTAGELQTAINGAVGAATTNNVNSATVFVNGTQLANPGTIEALGAAVPNVTNVTVTSDASLTPEQAVQLAAAGLTVTAAPGVTIEIEGTVTVAQALLLPAGSIYDLADSAGNLAAASSALLDDAESVSVSSPFAQVFDLLTIDGNTVNVVNAVAVTEIQGNSGGILATYAANTAGTISGLGDEAVDVNGVFESLSAIAEVDAATTGQVTVSGSILDLIANADGLNFSADFGGTASSVTLFGSAGNQAVTGSFGDDDIEGGEGDDTIDGGWGNDDIVGGEGADTLTGGKGSDTFEVAFGTADLGDTITDFEEFASDVLDFTGVSDVNNATLATVAASVVADPAPVVLSDGFNLLTGITAATTSAADVETALLNGSNGDFLTQAPGDIYYIALNVTDVDAVTAGDQAGAVVMRYVESGVGPEMLAAELTQVVTLIGVDVANLTAANFDDFS